MSDIVDGVRAGGCTRRGLLGRGALATAALAAPAALAAGAPPAGAAPLAHDAARGNRRLVVWRGTDAWRSEATTLRIDRDGIVAEGTQVGFAPMLYKLDYRLDAGDDFITRRLVLTAEGTGWWRHLDLRSDGRGRWTVDAKARGDVRLPDPGGDASTFAGALDCDLGFSPLTNTMPIRRSGLTRREGAEDFLMAWVAVPDLTVVASGQRYEHVRVTDRGSVVRYVDRGLFPGFTAELQLDRTGICQVYPDLAKVVKPKR